MSALAWRKGSRVSFIELIEQGEDLGLILFAEEQPHRVEVFRSPASERLRCDTATSWRRSASTLAPTPLLDSQTCCRSAESFDSLRILRTSLSGISLPLTLARIDVEGLFDLVGLGRDAVEQFRRDLLLEIDPVQHVDLPRDERIAQPGLFELLEFGEPFAVGKAASYLFWASTLAAKVFGLHNKVRYNYIEMPINYTVDFKGKLGRTKEFKYFLGVGPVVLLARRERNPGEYGYVRVRAWHSGL